MNKIVIETSHCLMGIGYTSIIASHLLKEKGIDSIVIGLSNDKAVFDLQLSNCSISPLPIFPVKDSHLYQSLKLSELSPQTILEVTHSEIKNCNPTIFNIQIDSLAEFIYKDSTTLKAFGLSLKQWGPKMLEKPYSEVQNKIRRQYLSGNNNSRVGYINGFTLYYHIIKHKCPNILDFNTINKIDYKNKIVFADSFEIHFKKLISTIPVNHLLSNCNMNLSIPLIFEGSYFFYYSHKSDFQANKMIYDYDLKSDIIRAFSATDNIIVAQLPGYKKGKIKISDISERLYELIPDLRKLNFEKELFLSMSYPIETITDSQTLENIQMLKENSVLTFGRFGSWKYLDLHELNWDEII